MKKTLLIVLFMSISVGYTQVKKRPFFYFKTREQITEGLSKSQEYDIPYHYLLADGVRLREKPTTDSKLIIGLPIGTKFTIEKKDKQVVTLGKVNANWYKIKTEKYEGWVFGAFIAKGAFGSSVDTSVKFYYGIGLSGKTEIRAVQNGVEIDKVEIKPRINYVTNLGGKAIQGVQDVIQANMPCNGGCGCATGECVVFWSGVKFSKVYQLNAVADAYASEGDYFIYPSDIDGEDNAIVWVSTSYLDAKEGTRAVRHKVVKAYYYWNGMNLQKDTSRQVEVSYRKSAY